MRLGVNHQRAPSVVGRLLLVAAVTTVLILSGCGQKGPLYIPDTAQQKSQEEES